MAGSVTAAGSIQDVRAGGAVTANLSVGVGTPGVTQYDSGLASQSPPNTPTADWLAGALQAADEYLAGVVAGLEGYRAEIDAWAADVASAKSEVAQGVSDAKAEAQAAEAELESGLSGAVADLEAARGELAAALSGEVSAQGVAAAAAKAEAAQALRDALSVAKQEHTDAKEAIAQAAKQARATLDAAIESARGELRSSVEQSLADLAGLRTKLGTERGEDVKARDEARTRYEQSRSELVDRLTQEGGGGAYWDATVQAKVDDTLDYVQIGLAIVGLIPGPGTVSSAASLFIDLWRGHYLSAVLDGVGVVPVVGSAANALKLTRFGVKAWSRLAAASRVASAMKRLRDFKRTLALAAQSGTLRSRASYYAYDFVFCKVLRLACFTAGTPVECEFGSVVIEDITRGTRVWSRGEFDAEGAVELKVVEEVFERFASVMRVKLAGGVEFGTTHEHPFWVAGKGWVVARELAAGDKLVGRDGGEVAVEGVSETGEWARVYNFRVADHHTYFVGGQEWGCSVWTHNSYATLADRLAAVAKRTPADLAERNRVLSLILKARRQGDPEVARLIGRLERAGVRIKDTNHVIGKSLFGRKSLPRLTLCENPTRPT